jgi:hypothetical protein
MNRLGDVEMARMRDILHNSNLKRLDILYLHGDSSMGLEGTKDFLPALLNCTTKQIFLDSFILSEADLQMIFRNSTHCKYLDIINCEIGHLGNTFHIPKDQVYHMKTLDLFWTAIFDNDRYFDQHKLAVLLRAIRGTKLESSLRNIHVCEDDFFEDELLEVLERENLGFKVYSDYREPEVYH